MLLAGWFFVVSVSYSGVDLECGRGKQYIIARFSF